MSTVSRRPTRVRPVKTAKWDNSVLNAAENLQVHVSPVRRRLPTRTTRRGERSTTSLVLAIGHVTLDTQDLAAHRVVPLVA